MTLEQAFELIQQNGVGQDIRCFLSTENKERTKDHMSLINNYKYKEDNVKFYVDKDHLKKHEKTLNTLSTCILFIKQDKYEKKKTVVFTVKLFCKFTEIKNQFIYARPFSVNYIDDDGKSVSYKIM